MNAFPSPLTATPAPLILDNVDTDTIIPSREMRTTGREGLADGLFAPWRYLDADSRRPDPQFVLNTPAFSGTSILLGGANFGCGSSREHAVWALVEYGIRAIIAVSFAPIFKANCEQNGVVPIALSREAIEQLSGQSITIDLEQQTVHSAGLTYPFTIDPEAKEMMLEGLDAIDLTLTRRDEIARWIEADRSARPWIYVYRRPS